MNITELEKDVIVAIAENEYADNPTSVIWSFAISYQTKITKKNQISGVVSSLVKKGLAVSSTYAGEDDTVWLTKLGVEQYYKIKDNQIKKKTEIYTNVKFIPKSKMTKKQKEIVEQDELDFPEDRIQKKEIQNYSFAGGVCLDCYDSKIHRPPDTRGD